MNVGDIRKLIKGLPAKAPVLLHMVSCPADDLNVVIETIQPSAKRDSLGIHVSILTDEELAEMVEEEAADGGVAEGVEGGHRDLFVRLADNLQPEEEGGWCEDPTDRRVTVTGTDLLIRTTFEHDDDRGGRQRFETRFFVKDGKLWTDNEDSCPLGDEDALQRFVNGTCGYQGP